MHNNPSIQVNDVEVQFDMRPLVSVRPLDAGGYGIFHDRTGECYGTFSEHEDAAKVCHGLIDTEEGRKFIWGVRFK